MFSVQFFSSLMRFLLILSIFLFHAVFHLILLILCFIFKVDYFSAYMTVFSIQMDSINYFECSLCFPDSVDFKKNVCIPAIL
jgi:hypothetical protein